jgi:hypothetical protein
LAAQKPYAGHSTHQCDQLAVDYSALIQFARELYERAFDDGDSFMFTEYSPALGSAVGG